MPSLNGPYTVLALFGEFFVEDKDALLVLDFQNAKPKSLAFDTESLAQSVATNLTTDDTLYRALVKAHYLGGTVSVNVQGINEIMAVIGALEVASFAADPVAVSAIARLFSIVALL